MVSFKYKNENLYYQYLTMKRFIEGKPVVSRLNANNETQIKKNVWLNNGNV